MDDPTTSTASALCAALAAGEVSSRELLDAMLARIDEVNPALNAVVALDADRARAAAAAADAERAAGTTGGRLHGLPITIKDVWETEGLVTTAGAPELASHVPTTDAIAVRRLKDAGAIVVGKTNVPLYAGDIQTFNDVYGVTNNPWDLSRTPGGSSGGAAAAIASGITSFELGSDIGGSIREPSHFCGVFGLKPSWGVIPSRGHIPGPPGSLTEVDVNCAGPMGRSVADLRLGLDVLAGPTPEQGVGWRLELPRADPRPDGPNGLRVAIVFSDADFPVASEVVAVMRIAADRWATAGALVEEIELPVSIAEGMRSWQALVLPVIGAGLPDHVYAEFAGFAEAPGDDIGSRSLRGLTARAKDVMRADERRRHHQRAWAPLYDSYDVVVTPVLQTAALEHDHRTVAERVSDVDGRSTSHLELTAWVGAIGVLLVPVVALPVGRTAGGLPVGVQVIGPMYSDYATLSAAEALSLPLDGFVAPPSPYA